MAYHFRGNDSDGNVVVTLDSGETEASMDKMSDGMGRASFIARCLNECTSYESEHGVRVTGKVMDGNHVVYEM